MSNPNKPDLALPPPPGMADIQRGLSTLPGLSPAVQAILPRLGDDDFEVAELCRLVGQDAILAARVLRLANSPFFGLPRQVGSLEDAVMVLGTSNLRGLVLSTGLIGVFPDTAATARSLATAAAAGVLARSLRRDVGLAFTSGLLHNLGALLLGHFAPDHWRALAGETGETVASRLASERLTFGFDNCALAAAIAGHWRFPAAIQSALRSHRQPPDDPVEPLADLVHAAWVLAANGSADDLAPAIASRLGLATEEGKAAIEEALRAAKDSLGAAEAR